MTSTSERSDSLILYVNGHKIVEKSIDPRLTLSTYLRSHLGLSGTKVACGEGGCGACTVMISTWNGHTVSHKSVNACLIPLVSMHLCAITTVEGIGSTRTKLHEVQKRLADAHGSQCGFCTPGFVMSMYSLLRNKAVPDMEDISTYFQGNLCRCTGYRPILEAYKTFTDTKFGEGNNYKRITTGKCPCKVNEEEPTDIRSNVLKCDPTQEAIFPSELKEMHPPKSRKYIGPDLIWYVPLNLKELFNIKKSYPDARIINGNTEVGIEVKFKISKVHVMIQTTQVNDLHNIEINDNFLQIGASCSLSKIEELCDHLIESEKHSKMQIIKEIKFMLQVFAGKQIRNVATLGGNISTGSPISDLLPILLSTSSILRVGSATYGLRDVTLDSKFFLGYRKNMLKNEEIIINVLIPFESQNEYFKTYKISKRIEDDIAIAKVAFGGIGPYTKLLNQTNSFLQGKPWNESTFELAMNRLLDETNIPMGSPGGMERYRQSLVLSLFYKSFLDINTERSGKVTSQYKEKEFKSIQLYDFSLSQGKNSVQGTIQKPKKHISADLHTTGEAKYVDDYNKTENEIFCVFVYSRMSNALIKSIEYSEAVNSPGVLGFISSKDIPKESNLFCVSLLKDELIFADTKVNCYGQIIGAILADTREHAKDGASKVQVDYEKLDPILTIEDAIESSSFFPLPHSKLQAGDPSNIFESCDHIIEGKVQTGAQEHFYLETQCGLIVPTETGILAHSSTQNPTETQQCIAKMLNIPMNQVNVSVKRLGGGFGGKETRSIPFTLAAAWAAVQYRKPKDSAVKQICPQILHFADSGGPQVMMIVENYIERVGDTLNMSPESIREINMYQEGDVTYYGQELENCSLRRCWQECEALSQFSERRRSVDEFNLGNKWRKRGLSMIPTKYGIAFGLPHLNQAGSLIHVYKDGSILASHGGVEMGQGLHIKIAQIISTVLEVPLSIISICNTMTDKVPNTSATAASVGSDLNGMAIKAACEEINKRLAPIVDSYPKASWNEIITLAYESSISLSCTGFYSTPDLGMNWKEGKGRPFNYFTYGVGCSVVEVDLLTGMHCLLKTDIVMDLGESLNPAIDIGQVEGAFVQGYGLYTMEQLLHTPDGELITKGPSNYKIPGFKDIPKEFNVSLLRGSKNSRAVYSSKAVGEPPLFLAASVYFAIKDALKYARKENNEDIIFNLEIPATSERIRLASNDWIISKIPPLSLSSSGNKPWSIQVYLFFSLSPSL
ncbi:XDH [Lepeophtheirus salmonis]|uniref:XDH n=1 Tax=Lepeophtheirus salmonis TaxID=72036 RepID=A0A7R8D430_LEPSM|nr:XDH [Lepeophtheirus salmonis]CAF3021899.1 XDH [Lepeophtheirus salmonis]